MPIDPIIFDTPEAKADRFITQRLTKMELSQLRESAHMTKKALSELSGLSTKCIADIESVSAGNPTFKSIMKYLDVLDYEICFRRKTF